MNKEAKIGLVIIFALLITFAAVLAKRLYSSHAAQEVLAVEDKGEKKSEESADTEKEASVIADKVKFATFPAGQPTVIAATTVSGKAPQGTANDGDQWSSESDSDKTKISVGSASDPIPPPSYMPEPPKADIDNRYDRYGTSAKSDSADYRDSYRQNLASTSTRAGRTYTVAQGDSLFDIARCELGKASRWAEIYDLNADVLGKNIDSLAPGTQIILPDDNLQKADTMTRRSRIN